MRTMSIVLLSATILASCGGKSDAVPASSTTEDPAETSETSWSRLHPTTPVSTPKPTVVPIPSTLPPPGTAGLTGTATLDSEEQAFLVLINDYRSQNGAPALKVSIALTQSSDWMSADMAAKGYFSHTDSGGRDPFVRMSAFGYSASGYRGENIAAGNSTAQATFTQWKNSAGHNANMLSKDYQVIGIGRITLSGSTYGSYWTTDFGSTVDALAQ